ncbi:ribonuclease E activity regulator RraA [Deinococcus humi]|uniref:4-hydroxy-4-methyl-2-oxoglutarate aldolase n=1 Tax=Deinococcus humi TaxID=662880 RepID=A0A7W8NCQ5_9DEIO|nr:ribonuclease E activity regulator RraA [Deinococcus humi]MBB5361546.1 regulator of ribonuclease activity A [Deinococcus humi]GGO20649.1 putative 4-hydroxy-4-methyl-2-oxoglutarate aldolase [Deinococcus humi]
MTPFTPTPDLCDAHPEAQVFAPIFRDFGGRARFSGPAFTLRVYENNTLVRATLETPGEARVMVVDGGGSLNCALVGDQLAGLGVENGWAGIIIHGCVRDTAQLREMPIGIRALAVHPRRSGRANVGETDVVLTVAGATVRPGDMVHADEDGICLLAAPTDQ